MDTDLRGRVLRVLDRAVEYGDLTRDEALALLDAGDRLAALTRAVREVYWMQCPPERSRFAADEFGDGAFCAHQWWSKVLGGVLDRNAPAPEPAGDPS